MVDRELLSTSVLVIGLCTTEHIPMHQSAWMHLHVQCATKPPPHSLSLMRHVMACRPRVALEASNEWRRVYTHTLDGDRSPFFVQELPWGEADIQLVMKI